MTETNKVWNNLHWFVIHTHARQEDRADGNLIAWGIETFTPKLREVRYKPYTGEPAYVVKPLFSRYLFARFRLSNLYHKIRFVRGIHSLVNFNNIPCPVDDELIGLIKARTSDDGFIRMADRLKPGDEVIIKEGPLKDFSGIFKQEMKSQDRIRILLNTVTCQTHVVIERRKVKRLNDNSGAGSFSETLLG